MYKDDNHEKNLAVVKDQALAEIKQELDKTTDLKALVTKLYVQNKLNELRLNEIGLLVKKPKDSLTLEEAAEFLGFRKSYLYRMVSERKIPHYKPFGKLVYFDRSELEELLKTNRVAPIDEIKAQANNYVLGNPLH